MLWVGCLVHGTERDKWSQLGLEMLCCGVLGCALIHPNVRRTSVPWVLVMISAIAHVQQS